MTKDTIGIDISKDHLDAHRLSTGQHMRFTNSTTGFRALACWIAKGLPDLVVFEPTGPYHARFERRFAGHLPLVKVNPLQARRFAQAQGTRAKTDAVDAQMLARMGAALELEPDRPTSQQQREINELQAVRRALVRDRTRLMNRLKTQTLTLTRAQTRARIAQAERQLKALDAEIDTRLRRCPQRARSLDILASIPGISAITARAILADCPEIGSLRAKQAAALAGLAPMSRSSGKWQGKERIQGGRKPLRDALYMPAIVAMRHNPDLARKYRQMTDAGKPHKLAITALMRKLIILANTLIKQNRPWTPKPA